MDELEGVQKLKIERLEDAMSMETPAVEYVWEGILPRGGTSLLCAKPKMGKSTLARNLAFCVSRGESFLGRQTTQGEVLYLSFEGHPGQLVTDFINLGASDEPIYICTEQAPTESLEALEEALDKYTPALCIVDPMFRLLRLPDSNDYSTVTAALEPITFLARRSNCHVMLVHHFGKSDRAHGDQILGSTALFAAVDTAVLLRNLDGLRAMQTIQRYGDPIEDMVVQYDKASGLLLAGTEGVFVGESALRQRVLEILLEQPMNTNELQRELKVRRQRLLNLLTEMVAEGSLERKQSPDNRKKVLFQVPSGVPE